MAIRTEGAWFKDEYGRTLLLRGVNLGGSSKVPRTPDGATWKRAGFFDHRHVSFVGRPFPLDEADEHFTRLKRWGLTFLRFLVTWEAIEHAGPAIYDEAYLDYLRAVVQKAAEHDLLLFIDPHQDMWSRFSGGDGAPGWTFDVLGMDITKFKVTGAAFTHQEHGDPLPRMTWPSNANRFACATMFTLFFGGHDFAPDTQVDGIPVQDYLQGHYFDALKQVALRLRDLPNVVGYDTLNEPLRGYIGSPDLHGVVAETVAQGQTPTIFQSMLLASGFAQQVAVRRLPPRPWLKSKNTVVNGQGVSLWRDGVAPIWRHHGVWDVDKAGQPHLLRPDYFYRVRGQVVNFDSHYFVPFVERYIQEIRSIHPEALIFVDPQPAEFAGALRGDYAPARQPGIVHAPHWYDGVAMGFPRYIPWLGVDAHGGATKLVFGRRRKRRNFVRQIRRLVEASEEMFGGVPTLIGETGIPFNLHHKQAYRTGDFSPQAQAMDDTMQALEANLVSFTLWNYTSDNSNARGDLWNDEDLSIFSRDQQTGSGESDDGGRALAAVVRPYALRIPGRPLRLSFDPHTKVFTFTFQSDPAITAPLELFVPNWQYPGGYAVQVSDGRVEMLTDAQLLIYYPQADRQRHTLRLTQRSDNECRSGEKRDG